MGVERITELADFSGATQQEGVLLGVRILGLQSLNGRTYSAKAARDAASLYEGAKVNVNHSKKAGEPRDYQERFGRIENVTFREGSGLYGDLHYNPKHAIAQQFEWDAKNAPKNSGFSHVVDAVTRNSGGKTIVESIRRVHSVDLVADPATTSGIFESLLTEPEPQPMLTLEAIKKDHPELLQEYLKEQADSQGATQFQEEVKALRAKLDAYESKEAAALIETEILALVEEHKLPEFAITDTFKAILREASGRDARSSLVKDKADAIAEARKPIGKPRSKEQTQFAGEQLTTEGLVSRLYS